MSPAKLAMSTGQSLELTSMTWVSSASGGRSTFTVSTFSRTFCSASSMSTLVSNSMVTMEMLSADVEVIFLMPLSAFISFSTRCVIRVSMSEGDTPK